MKRASAVRSATGLLALAALAGPAPASGTWTQQTIPGAGATSFEQWDGSTWVAQIIPNGDAQ